ncbi:MAG: peptidylprolyl isomerase [Phycisphaerales bacterium]|nr:peptidylprolyl isomerase [Phycisphaerales bacterium]
MQIAEKTVVSINYTLTDPKGEVLDTSKDRGPMTYLHGVGQIIPGLEKALMGKSAGEAMTVTIAAEEAYGARQEELVMTVPRERFQGVERMEVGMQFQAQGPQGRRVVTVVGFEGADVKVDANHPLAGMPLTFAVNVVEVRAATQEELDHGHVHGPEGHHHHH